MSIIKLMSSLVDVAEQNPDVQRGVRMKYSIFRGIFRDHSKTVQLIFHVTKADFRDIWYILILSYRHQIFEA